MRRPRPLLLVALAAAPLVPGVFPTPTPEPTPTGTATATPTATATASPGSTVTPLPRGTRPNVVVVMTDDQTLQSLSAMANTRRLLQEQGTTFTNAFVSYSLCCPSRASLLTGQYPHNHGVLSNTSPDGGYKALDHANTLPVWLRRAGYRTAHVGKYLNGYGKRVPPTTVPVGYDDWQGLIDSSSYRMYDYQLNDNGKVVEYGTAPADYQTDVLAERAERSIRTSARGAAPFFLSVAPLAPHSEEASPGYPDGGPPRPAPRHRGAHGATKLPKPPSFNEADFADKPRAIRGRPRLSKQVIRETTRSYRLRLASLLAVDDLVDRLVRTLEDTGELDRTVIAFTSDNGFMHGEHRFPTGKVQPYEPSTRVPLVVRGPGFAPGAQATALTTNVDLTASIVQASGAVPGAVLDGLPLEAVAAQTAEAQERLLLYETGTAATEGRRYVQAVRAPHELYIERPVTGEREYYDLRADPFELDNRADDPSVADRVGQLAAQLAELTTCRGDTCRRPVDAPLAPDQAPPTANGNDVDAVLTLPPRDPRLRPDGRVGIAVRCASGQEDGCRGALKLVTRDGAIGARRFSVPAGRTVRLRVKLNDRGRRLLATRRPLRVIVAARVVDVAGEEQRARRVVTLQRR